MISTRVMDIKLREAAEGFGEGGTGETPMFSALGVGRALFGCMEPCSVAFFVEGNIQPPYLVCSDVPQVHAVSGKTIASPLNAIWQHCFLAALPKSGVFVFFLFLEANRALLLT